MTTRGQQLHDQQIHGAILTPEEQVELAQWYAQADRPEGSLLSGARAVEADTNMQQHITVALDQLHLVTQRIQELSVENDYDGRSSSMQTYNQDFARAYDINWAEFAKQVAPPILDFYAATPAGRENKPILDLCCGTGQLALHFLGKGYSVVGLDLSEYMLERAKEKTHRYIETGQAKFILGDASNFKMDERYGLVVSTFDALNHLEDEYALKRCFECAYKVSEGIFVFDLNTRKGLRRWNNINIDDSREDALIIIRGIYDEQSKKAQTKITGFVRGANGLYERFDVTGSNTTFEMERVKNTLLDVGWKDVYFARIQDLNTPISDPEQEGRVFVIASR